MKKLTILLSGAALLCVAGSASAQDRFLSPRLGGSALREDGRIERVREMPVVMPEHRSDARNIMDKQASGREREMRSVVEKQRGGIEKPSKDLQAGGGCRGGDDSCTAKSTVARESTAGYNGIAKDLIDSTVNLHANATLSMVKGAQAAGAALADGGGGGEAARMGDDSWGAPITITPAVPEIDRLPGSQRGIVKESVNRVTNQALAALPGTKEAAKKNLQEKGEGHRMEESFGEGGSMANLTPELLGAIQKAIPALHRALARDSKAEKVAPSITKESAPKVEKTWGGEAPTTSANDCANGTCSKGQVGAP